MFDSLTGIKHFYFYWVSLMDIMDDKKDGVLVNIKNEIDESERKRKALRLNHNLSLLSSGKFHVFQNEEFVFGLAEHLTDRSVGDREEKIDLLKLVGHSSLAGNPAIKERSVMVLSISCEAFLLAGDNEFLFVLTEIFSDKSNLECLTNIVRG